MTGSSPAHRTPRHDEILQQAEVVAAGFGHDYVGVEHLFLAILDDARSVPTQVLAELIDPEEVAQHLRTTMQSEGYNTPSHDIAGPGT